ncbi:hypothetical protein ZHAS_00003859 [Anopheles sinensis]|uniref:Uncharacterized protein n=1 Tax=Anopheles sinensis TaxID=74873 RepID=A0A084VFG5_ANOSI|nr:hypothetical protein ZHAS_00003859 [Anopheles sinensis]
MQSASAQRGRMKHPVRTRMARVHRRWNIKIKINDESTPGCRRLTARVFMIAIDGRSLSWSLRGFVLGVRWWRKRTGKHLCAPHVQRVRKCPRCAHYFESFSRSPVVSWDTTRSHHGKWNREVPTREKENRDVAVYTCRSRLLARPKGSAPVSRIRVPTASGRLASGRGKCHRKQVFEVRHKSICCPTEGTLERSVIVSIRE